MLKVFKHSMPTSVDDCSKLGVTSLNDLQIDALVLKRVVQHAVVIFKGFANGVKRSFVNDHDNLSCFETVAVYLSFCVL